MRLLPKTHSQKKMHALYAGSQRSVCWRRFFPTFSFFYVRNVSGLRLAFEIISSQGTVEYTLPSFQAVPSTVTKSALSRYIVCSCMGWGFSVRSVYVQRVLASVSTLRVLLVCRGALILQELSESTTPHIKKKRASSWATLQVSYYLVQLSAVAVVSLRIPNIWMYESTVIYPSSTPLQ